MAYQKYVAVDGNVINVGDKFEISEGGSNTGIAPLGVIVTVSSIKIDEGKDILIGLRSSVSISHWNNLNNSVEERRGYWIHARDIKTYLTPLDCLNDYMVVTKDFKFKKRNIKGMKAKLICQTSFKTSCFIELEENVGGGSADGTGKAGHCVVVPAEILSNKTTKQKPKEVINNEQQTPQQ